MTRATTALSTVTALACCAFLFSPAAAAELTGPDLDKLFQAVGAYRVGQDEKPLIAVSELVRRSWRNPERRRAIEDRLASLLASGTDDGKRFVCRQLWMAASRRSVPALAKLLADEKLSDAARYALERLADPAAGAALRDAVGKTNGRALVGVVNSIGHRRDKDAVGLLLPLLGSRDQAVADATAWSLGRIGGAEAAKALVGARGAASGKARRVLDDACLRCADGLAADGRQAAAAAVYRRMYADHEPRRIRIAALRGLMVAGLLAALMSTIEAALNSTATVTAEDIVKRLRPGIKDRTLVLIGRITAAAVILLAMAWSTQGGKFSSIFVAINKIPMMFAPAITTVFVMGVFWRRGTNKAALATLIAGGVVGAAYFIIDLPVFGDVRLVADPVHGLGIPFMMAGLILLLFCVFVYVTVSLATTPPPASQLENLCWERPWKAITEGKLRGVTDPRIMAAVLLIIMVILYAIFH